MKSGSRPSPRPRDLWTGLVVDRVAEPIAERLAPRREVSPNRITALAGLLAIASALAFALGYTRLGGLLFLLRFVFDVMDGMVARIQGTSSSRGAALDQIVDVAGIALVMLGMGWQAVHSNVAPLWTVLVLVYVVTIFNWLLTFRKKLATDAGLPSQGGSGGRSTRDNRWTRWAQSRNIMPYPYSVEAETLVFGIIPAFTGNTGLLFAIAIGILFYALASVINLRRIFRICRHLDQEGPIRR